MNDLTDLITGQKGGRGELIPLLQRIQESDGYLSQDAITRVAKSLRVPPSEIYGVLTFYSQFRTTPTGKNRVMVCRGTACHVKGGPRVLRAVKQALDLEEGESTPDLEYTLDTVACIGACALAPTMMINKETYGRLTPQKVPGIFDRDEEKK